MTQTQLLERAKAEILTRGWCQGTSYDYNTGRVCMYGAIAIADNAEKFLADTIPIPNLRVYQALDLMHSLCGNLPVPTWNDAPERTLQDVLDVFDAAIAISAAKDRVQEEVLA